MRILIVENDLSQEDIEAIKQNLASSGDKQEVILLDVIPKIPAQYYLLPDTEELERKLNHKALDSLSHHGEQLGVANSNRVLKEGGMKEEVYAFAEQQHVDVIVAHNPNNLKLHSFFDRWFNHATHQIPVVNPLELKETILH